MVDVRLTVAGGPCDDPPGPRVLGLKVSPRTRSSYLGFERSGDKAPAMVAAIERWRHPGTFLAAWEDVARVGTDAIWLGTGFTRYPAVLREPSDSHV